MRKLEKFLFFYSILAVTVFLLSFGIFSPKPLNLISGIALIPIVIYFWLRLTSPETVGAEKWSARFLLVIIALSSLGIFGYWLNSQKNPSSEIKLLQSQLAESLKKNEEISLTLKNTSAELDEIKSKNDNREEAVEGSTIADLISETPSPGSVQRVTGKVGVNQIDVYQNNDTSSKKIGGLEPGLNYPYSEKKGGWYKVVVTSSETGWVSASQVQEVP